MIDLNQEITIKWTRATKKYYESIGYTFTEYGDEFIIRAKDLKESSGVKVRITCDCCGKPRDIVYGVYNKTIKKNNGIYLCNNCGLVQRDRERWPKEEMFGRFIQFCTRNFYEPISTINDYKNVKEKLYYKCPIHGVQSIIVDNIRADSVGCSGCLAKIAGDRRRSDIDEIIEIVESKGNKLLNPEDYVDYRTKNLIIECGICHDTFVTSLSSQVNSDGACLKCGYRKTGDNLKLTVEDLNKIYNTNEIMLLNPQDYIDCKTRNLKFKCIVCGETFITSKSNYDNGTKKCHSCSRYKSTGEELVEKFLLENDIEYDFQHHFDDCRDTKTLPFDFYLEQLNAIIEFDGRQHFEPIFGQESLESTQKHDKIKNQYCKDNDIKLIRIPYWESQNIAQIISNELNI